MHRGHALSTVGIRITIVMVCLAIGALGVFSLLTLQAARGDVSATAREQQKMTANAIATVIKSAYRTAGSWHGVRLRAAATLAVHNLARLTVIQSSGAAVALPHVAGRSPPPVLQGPLFHYSIVYRQRSVGTVVVHFFRSSLPSPQTHLRNALIHTVAVGALLGLLLALGAALVISRWITRPIVGLTDALRSRARGDRDFRTGARGGSGELAELGRAFDEMADSIDHQELLRRNVVTDVAHELRTPIAILQASTEHLVDRTSAPTPKVLRSLHQEVLRVGRIVEDLETLALADEATLQLDPRPTDLLEVVKPTLDMFRPSCEDAGIELTSELTSAFALADSGRTVEILQNLLANALKFTETGGRVAVSLKPGGGGAVLIVSDTGMGIPPDDLPHVFERFWRGRQVGRTAGSGIGLAVVRTLVDAQHGTVDVVSRPSRGAEFRVWFPPAASAPSPGSPAATETICGAGT